ncbi:hypothetical protein GF359_05610 [candidate division WOR-3 bacterium]|uniref:Omp28-related outer membrane protein n=1 Tax=candidate division WOR-3 bacterium TaxID=2052148 RepID=A0A9D5K991_UNCW3|nr:hypothetical protein [candidate division WOR-3 bacterium]MBD3364673.1 hypothetical protein [candidate division WOR-3 bacterium]
MRKIAIVLLGLFLIPVLALGEERVVTLEIFTRTGCPTCPGAAMGAEDLHEAFPGKVLIVEYHNSDNFQNTDAVSRNGFYGEVIRGVPASIFDGIDTLIGGFYDQSLFDPWYLHFYNNRLTHNPPLAIELTKETIVYESSTGQLNAKITNISNEAVTGIVHFTVTESNIPYAWQNQTHLHFVERVMLPDASGQEITLEPGEELDITRNYTISDSWPNFTNDNNIEFGCFVQSTEGSGKLREIFQADVIPFNWVPIEVTSTSIDNTDGKLHPGETSPFLVTLLNGSESSWLGQTGWSELTGLLSTNDTLIEIIDENGTWPQASAGEEATNTLDPFEIKLDESGTTGYRPVLNLVLNGTGVDDFELNFKLFEPVAVSGRNEIQISVIAPELIKGKGIMSITVSEPTEAYISIIDVTGRIVETFEETCLNTGLNLLPISANNLSEGVYFIKSDLGFRTEVNKVLIVR